MYKKSSLKKEKEKEKEKEGKKGKGKKIGQIRYEKNMKIFLLLCGNKEFIYEKFFCRKVFFYEYEILLKAKQAYDNLLRVTMKNCWNKFRHHQQKCNYLILHYYYLEFV